MASLLLLRAPVAALAAWAALGAQEARRPEYQTKADLIRNLVNYVNWPQNGDRPLRLGVMGVSPFEGHLNNLASGRGRRIRLAFFRSMKGLEDCDAVFICESEEERLPEILRALQGRPTLTLGDTPGFAQRGVMINLVVTQERVVLEVNLKMARQADLGISSAVLSRAKVYGDR
ncbi:MAG: hypothetical protein BWY56_00461 [Acidobacteria bacterium ADurb.Bin340]|nr:MAG: hypothetical protein BWY56_00461 [Acidobacteria bacterium ADurb.Bin340]